MGSSVQTAQPILAPTAGPGGAAIEHAACPLCNADSPLDTSYRRDPYAVVRCGRCAAWYLSPRLTEAHMRAYYQRNDYFVGAQGGYADYSAQERSLRATFGALLGRLAARNAVGGALLEVGCGYGFLLREAAPYFRERVGCEMAPGAAERARAHADEVYLGTIESIPPGRRFDCIVAAHVLEHIYRPHEFLTRLCGHLKAAGTVVLAVPDMDGFWRRMLGRRWPSFKYPEHVVFYDQKSLHALMRQAGLTAIRTIPYPHACPLGEVCRKLGVPSLPGIAKLNVWLPGTTLAMLGRAPGAGTI
jgi:SAM-dependent methyltransferase